MAKDVLDLAGIGAGPFNLSVAALLDAEPHVNARFFEAKSAFDWHPGMQLPGARLQTSYLKDLVSGVDPCNRHSFLNYLVQTGRFYPFLSANLPAISRKEFADYLAWAAGNLRSLRFDHPVEAVDFNGDHFELQIRGRSAPVLSRNLCVGTGIRPLIPPACDHLPPDRSVHCIDLMNETRDFTGEHVVVVGGGQSGAEVLLALLDGLWGHPASIRWLSRRPNFEPLDETPFSNLYFTPDYVRSFTGLPEHQRRDIVRYQKLASDGISPDTLNLLYQRLYEYPLEHPGRPVPELLPGRTLYAVTSGQPMTLLTRNRMDEQFEEFQANRLILCTGFEHTLPDCLAPLRPRLRLDRDGRPVLSPDFAMIWQGPEDRSIYAVNQGRLSHGIADSQLSLMCWRSAVIVNHLLGIPRYPVQAPDRLVRWRSGTDPHAATPVPQDIATTNY